MFGPFLNMSHSSITTSVSVLLNSFSNITTLPLPFLLLSILSIPVFVWLLSYSFDWVDIFFPKLKKKYFGKQFFPSSKSNKNYNKHSLFSPASKYISLIIPAFNEEKRISIALDDIFNYLERRSNADESFTYEIICVDDGSTDKTVSILSSYVEKYGQSKIRVIESKVNAGKGSSVKTGMLSANGELLIFLDADGATNIADLAKLESKIMEGVESQRVSKSGSYLKFTKMESFPFSLSDASICSFGSRAHLEKIAIAQRKWYRNLMMYVFHFVVLIVTGPTVKDSQCGFKMFTRKAARLLFPNQRLKRWSFDVELIYLCKRFDIPIHEVSVEWCEIPGSKIRITSIIDILLELAIVRLYYGFRIWRVSS